MPNEDDKKAGEPTLELQHQEPPKKEIPYWQLQLGLWVGIFAAVIGSLTGAIALADMVPWVTWVDRLADLLASYRAIVGPIFEWFEWLIPFEVPWWLRNYLVIGLTIVVGMIRGFIKSFEEIIGENKFVYHTRMPIRSIYIISFLFWPLALPIFIISFINFKYPNGPNILLFVLNIVLRLLPGCSEFFHRFNYLAFFLYSVAKWTLLSFTLAIVLLTANFLIQSAYPSATTPDYQPKPLWHIEALPA